MVRVSVNREEARRRLLTPISDEEVARLPLVTRAELSAALREATRPPWARWPRCL